MIDPFELLGLSQDSCTSDQAHKAFSDLVLLVHPDKGGTASDMRVITSAYRYVRRCIKVKEAMELTFEEYYKEIDDGSELEKQVASTVNSNFNLANFNRAFEQRNPHEIYAGPAQDDATESCAVRMAAAGAGTAGEGYGDAMDPSDDMEAPCKPLVRNELTIHREPPSRLPRIVPEHGPQTLDITDYADAFSASAASTSQLQTKEESVMDAFERCLQERLCQSSNTHEIHTFSSHTTGSTCRLGD